MRELVFKFVDNGIEYIVFKEDDKYIPCKNENDSVSFDLNQEEFNLVKYVFNKIKVTNDRVELANVLYNGKEFKHFYDKTNDFNVFLNIDGSEISKDELKHFNNLYNYQNDIMYSSNKKVNLDDNFFKRVINGFGRTLVVLVSSTMLVSCGKVQGIISEPSAIETTDPTLTYIGKENIDVNILVPAMDEKVATAPVEEPPVKEVTVALHEGLEEKDLEKYICYDKKNFEVRIVDSTEFEFDSQRFEFIPIGKSSKITEEEELQRKNNIADHFDRVANEISEALDENTFLSEKEKSFIISNIFIFAVDDYYMDMDLITERLKTLQFAYDGSEAQISGEYSTTDNVITIYGASDIYSADTKTLRHELRHVTQKATNYAGLYEAMTKYLNGEDFEKDDYLTTYFNILTHTVSLRSLKEYYYSGDISRLKQELMNIYNDEVDQYQLLNDFSRLYADRYLSNSESIDAKMQELNDAKRLEKDLDRLYMKRHDGSMYEDEDVAILLKNIHKINNDVLGYQCVYVKGTDENGNPILEENTDNIVLPIIISQSENPEPIAPDGYILQKTYDYEYIGLQVRKMSEDDFDSKIDELMYQRELTNVFDGYQYLNEKDRLEGYVKIGVNQDEENTLDINIKDATGKDEDSKLRFNTEYAKYVAGQLLNNPKGTQERDIEVALNGKILTINDKDNSRIYNINIEEGSQPVLVQVLNQANMSFDEYTALLNGEVQNYIYDTRNKYENYSKDESDEIGLDNKGNIISYVNIKLNNSENNINNIPIKINPSDAINYTHHSKGMGNL